MGNRTVTRADLVESIYEEVGLSRNESSDLVEAVLDEISDALVAGDNVKLSSFGSFSVREKGERIGRNPKTGVEVPISPRRVLVFRASHVLKDRIAEGPDGGSESSAPVEEAAPAAEASPFAAPSPDQDQGLSGGNDESDDNNNPW